jgi:50S ribosomal subunit-associated GTPase HflX
MHLIGQLIKEEGVNAVFINTNLSQVQVKNLEKILGAMANG